MVVIIPAYRPSLVSIHSVIPDASILSSSFGASVLSAFVLGVLVVVGLAVAIYTGALFPPQPRHRPVPVPSLSPPCRPGADACVAVATQLPQPAPWQELGLFFL
ncbi:hypothetical protein E2562_004811 [Oryza meyeriana var. granulata]|uniref:Uncharacterized protein n=1 Tax=Oryza meyeriana var. granulata TaxID=110450 RepID=A0A6G1DDG0_9ORYZ|nr:hypothetical protein E2562_004811 [Oryza meyeriana var. granulata]